jgi:sulfur-carrier protein
MRLSHCGQAFEAFKMNKAASNVEYFLAPHSRYDLHIDVGTAKACLLARYRCASYNSFMAPVPPTVSVKVLFFGRLKEVVGHAEESFDLADASTIEELFALYAARIPELAKYRSSVVASRNQEFVSWDTTLRSGDEVAFLPPVSGG